MLQKDIHPELHDIASKLIAKIKRKIVTLLDIFANP